MISYGRQSINETDFDAIRETLESDYLTAGPRVSEFEEQLCQATGAHYAIACSSCTTALHMACLALGVGPGDRGLTSPITFVASANAIEMCGGHAGLIDIDDSYCLSPQLLEEHCRLHAPPKVVIPVSFAGIPAQLPQIFALGQKYGFSVIEDAAHSLGSEYVVDGCRFRSGGCSHSHLAVLSFHPVKTITTGEGGAVLTNDKELARKLRLLRSHGIERDPSLMTRSDGRWYYEMQSLGYNYRITDIQCALGISQLHRLNEFKQRRREIVSLYDKAFSSEAGVAIPPRRVETDPLFHIYPVRFTSGPVTRKLVYEHLYQRGIQAQVHYIPVHFHPYYKQRYTLGVNQFPASESYYSQCLSLPLHCALSDADVRLVIEQVLEAIAK